MAPKIKKKFVFYVDTECSLSTKSKCSYYSSKQVQEQAAKSATDVWGQRSCPIVYVKSGSKSYTAFCPTKGGPWGEQLPIPAARPGPNALRIEVTPRANETWPEILEKAAKMACETRCE